MLNSEMSWSLGLPVSLLGRAEVADMMKIEIGGRYRKILDLVGFYESWLVDMMESVLS